MRLTLVAMAAAVRASTSVAVAYSDLAGKRVLVTGSSGGIGAGIAKLLGRHGARLMLHYNTREDGALATAEAIRAEGGNVDGILACDFRSRQAISEMWKLVDERWDAVDVLVNNGQSFRPHYCYPNYAERGVWPLLTTTL